jgi:hypothetical protein
LSLLVQFAIGGWIISRLDLAAGHRDALQEKP